MRWPAKAPLSRVDQLEDSPIAGGRGRPRKIIWKTIKRDLEFNSLNVNMIYDRILWHRLIYIASPT